MHAQERMHPPRPPAHHNDVVGQKDRFIHAVRDENDGDTGPLPYFDQAGL
jgi:hypothetical protein